MASAVAIARLIASILPAEGDVPDDAVRTTVRRKLSPLSNEQFRAAVIVGRARGDFRVAPDGALSRQPETPHAG